MGREYTFVRLCIYIFKMNRIILNIWFCNFFFPVNKVPYIAFHYFYNHNFMFYIITIKVKHAFPLLIEQLLYIETSGSWKRHYLQKFCYIRLTDLLQLFISMNEWMNEWMNRTVPCLNSLKKHQLIGFYVPTFLHKNL